MGIFDNRQYAKASYEDLVEVLRYLSMPRSERLKLAYGIVGEKNPPPWLRDEVMDVLFSTGLIRHEAIRSPKESEAGDMLSIDNTTGTVCRIVLTDRGKRSLELGIAGKPLDIDISGVKIEKPS